MRNLIFASLVIICLCQCSPCRHCPAANTPAVEWHDSIKVEYRERIIHDTVDFVPPEFYMSQISTDTLSVIENDYAKTVAVVHDGLLSHSLESKPTIIRIPVEVPVHDTLVVEKESEKLVEYVEVEKDLTKWQMFKMKFGELVFGALIILGIGLGIVMFLNKSK